MGNRKNLGRPNKTIPGNERHSIHITLTASQRKNLDTALTVYRIHKADTTIQDLLIEALEAYYGPQDVRKSRG